MLGPSYTALSLQLWLAPQGSLSERGVAESAEVEGIPFGSPRKAGAPTPK
jgi:hypothetical protein